MALFRPDLSIADWNRTLSAALGLVRGDMTGRYQEAYDVRGQSGQTWGLRESASEFSTCSPVPLLPSDR